MLIRTLISRSHKRKATLIRSSGLFSDSYYLSQLGPSAKSIKDPVSHYLLHGARMGLSPSPLFDREWYLGENPDVAASAQGERSQRRENA